MAKENAELKAKCKALTKEINELKANLENTVNKQQESIVNLETKYNDRNFQCTNIENSYKHLKSEIENSRRINDKLRLELEGAEIDVLNYSSKNSELSQLNEKLLTRIDEMDYITFKARYRPAITLRIVNNVVDLNIPDLDFFKTAPPGNHNEVPIYDIDAISKDIGFNQEKAKVPENCMIEEKALLKSNKDLMDQSKDLSDDKALSIRKVPSEHNQQSRDKYSADSKARSAEEALVEEKRRSTEKPEIEEKAKSEDKEQAVGIGQFVDNMPAAESYHIDESDQDNVKESPPKELQQENSLHNVQEKVEDTKEGMPQYGMFQDNVHDKTQPRDSFQDMFQDNTQAKPQEARDEVPQTDVFQEGTQRESTWDKPQRISQAEAEEEVKEKFKEIIQRQSQKEGEGFEPAKEETAKRQDKPQTDEKLQSEENLQFNFDGEGSLVKETPSNSLLSPGTPEQVYRIGQGVTTDLADVYKKDMPGASMINAQMSPDTHKMYQSVIAVKEKEVRTSEEAMMLESERRYRNCLEKIESEWYDSQWLQIIVTRNVHKDNKFMECKLTFINKCETEPITIKTLEPISYDTNGNHLINHIAISISVDRLPEMIPAKGQAEGSITLSVLNLFMIDTIVKLEYKVNALLHCLVKFPVSIFMFCKQLDVSQEEYDKALEDLQNEKLDGGFTLDISRIGSKDKIEKAMTMNANAKILPYKAGDFICAGTEYEDDNGKLKAFIEIKVNIVGQSNLSVYSEDQAFREVITRDLLNILAQI